LLRDPRTSAVKYIGKTTRPKVRFVTHLSGKGNELIGEWVAELSLFGLSPVMEIIDECPRGIDRSIEGQWIDAYKYAGEPLLNRYFEWDMFSHPLVMDFLYSVDERRMGNPPLCISCKVKIQPRNSLFLNLSPEPCVWKCMDCHTKDHADPYYLSED
jgi:hypothetical protein